MFHTPRLQGHACWRASLLGLFLLAPPLAAQEIPDTGATRPATPQSSRTHSAAAGARTVTIYPDSLPDVPRTMSELLAMAAPGVFVQHSSGAMGAGSWISIRDGAAARGAEPLVVVDGVELVSFALYVEGTAERRPPSRIDEIPVSVVERVDILAGPAAAARYGRDARAGVIEITTRSPGHGRPVVRASIATGGTASADRFPRNSTRIGSDGYVCGATDARTACASPLSSRYTPLLDASPFQSAPLREGRLAVAGGIGGAGYAVDLSHERAGGVLDADGRDLTAGGVRVALPMPFGGRLALSSRASVRGATIPFEGNSSLVAQGLAGRTDCSSATPCLYGDTVSRGYGAGAPEVLARRGTKHRGQHFTSGATLAFEPRSWLALRTIATNDGYLDQGGWRRAEDTFFYGPYRVVDERSEHSVRNVLGQEAVARRAAGGWELATSLAFRNEHERSRLFAYDFQGSESAYSWTMMEGLGAQRRQIVALAPRLSDGRASIGLGLTRTQARLEGFSGKTKATIDGSADASWVVASDSGAAWLRGAVVRAAFGQVSAYDVDNAVPGAAGSTIGFTLVPGRDGVLRPDRTYEGEAGVDVSVAPAATRLSLTAYRRRETHRSMYLIIGSQAILVGTLGRLVNGAELSAHATPVDRGVARLETDVVFTLQSDRVRRFDPEVAYFGQMGYGGNSLAVRDGKSLGSFETRSYTYDDANHNGVLDYAEVQFTPTSYFGRSRPSRFGSLDSRLTVARRWTLGASVGYLGGHKVLDKVETIRCAARLCDAWQRTTLADQAHVMVQGGTSYFVSGDALRVRELSLGYGIPSAARAARASEVRLTVAMRNVATFSHARYLDPETELPTPGLTSAAMQGPSYGTPRTMVFRLSALY